MPFSSWQLCLTHEKRTNEARKGFSRGLQGTLSLDYSIIHIINSCVLFMLLKENTRKRWIILVWLLCLLSSQLSHVWGRGWEKGILKSFYLLLPASRSWQVTGKRSKWNFWNSDFFWIDFIFWQGSLAGRLVNALEARGEEAGGNVGTVACLVKTSITQPTLGGTSSWLLMMEPAWCSALYCLGQKTPKDHFWILAFFTQSNFSRWQRFQREVDGGELPAAGGGGDREGDGDSAKGEGGNICQMLLTYLRN